MKDRVRDLVDSEGRRNNNGSTISFYCYISSLHSSKIVLSCDSRHWSVVTLKQRFRFNSKCLNIRLNGSSAEASYLLFDDRETVLLR